MKRSQLDNATQSPQLTKKVKLDSIVLSPQVFYLNRISKLYVNTIPETANEDAITLQDLFADNAKLIRVVLSTYNLDVDWLFTELELLKELPCTIVHGSDELQRKKSDFERKYKKLKLHKPPLPIAYGTQHGKLMLLYYEKHLRLVITTANLVERDWHKKQQCIWTQKFDLKNHNSSKSCEFEETLIDYLNRSRLTEDVKECKNYDFSSAAVTLITSVPGRFSSREMLKYGHFKLRRELSRQFSLSGKEFNNVLFTFSSVGSLSQDWLNDFQSSVYFSKDGWDKHVKSPLKLIWPTTEEVRTSYFGFRGADHLKLQSKNAKDVFTRLLHHWKGSPPGRERLLSHAKVIARYDNSNNIAWVYVGSANLSKAAWGEYFKTSKKFQIRSYEIGVLMIPSQKTSYFYSHAPTITSTEKGTRIGLPLPCSLPLTPYSKTDRPFIADGTVNIPDTNGEVLIDGILQNKDPPTSSTNKFTKEELLMIHQAIHSKSKFVTVRGEKYKIQDGKYRQCSIKGEIFSEQNKEKSSKYAKMAREGKKITWIIREGQWGLIIDGKIVQY